MAIDIVQAEIRRPDLVRDLLAEGWERIGRDANVWMHPALQGTPCFTLHQAVKADRKRRMKDK